MKAKTLRVVKPATSPWRTKDSVTLVSLQPGDRHFSPSFYGDFQTPEGYMLGEKYTYAIKENKEGAAYASVIADSPIWIESFQRSIDSNEHALTISCMRYDDTITHTVTRGTIASKSQIRTLADSGFPINDENASAVIKYLAACEKANEDRLEVQDTATSLGWINLPYRTPKFALGRSLYEKGCKETTELVPAPKGGMNKDWYDKYSSAGTDAAWSECLPIIAEHPPMLVSVLASIASPLLQPLKVSNFLVEYSGLSHTGKTVAIRAGMSVWGKCEEEDIPNFNGTSVGIEVRGGFCKNLPLVLDELKQFKGKNDEVTSLILMLRNGVGRTRARVDRSLQDIPTWRLITFLTGEHSVTTLTQDNGVKARLLSFKGSPFGEISTTIANKVRVITSVIENNYGHAGKRVAQLLVDVDAEGWDKLRTDHAAYAVELRSRAAHLADGVQYIDSWSKIYAVLFLAGRMLAKLYPGKISEEQIRTALFDRWTYLLSESAETHYAERALEDVRVWMAGGKVCFDESDLSSNKELVGKRVLQGQAIMSKSLHSYLKDAGYNAKAVIDEWENKGYIVKGSGADGKHNLRILGTQVKCIVLARDAISPPEPTYTEADIAESLISLLAD